MKPYSHIKLIERPDVGDIQSEARHSSVGKLPEKGGDYKPYIRKAAARKAARRHLKKENANREAREARRDGE
jgi:hypothetical protein